MFNAAYGLEVVADVFDKRDALDNLAKFVSANGCEIYGVEPPAHSITLTSETVETERAASLSTVSGDDVVLFGTEEATRWTVS